MFRFANIFSTSSRRFRSASTRSLACAGDNDPEDDAADAAKAADEDGEGTPFTCTGEEEEAEGKEEASESDGITTPLTGRGPVAVDKSSLTR